MLWQRRGNRPPPPRDNRPNSPSPPSYTTWGDKGVRTPVQRPTGGVKRALSTTHDVIEQPLSKKQSIWSPTYSPESTPLPSARRIDDKEKAKWSAGRQARYTVFQEQLQSLPLEQQEQQRKALMRDTGRDILPGPTERNSAGETRQRWRSQGAETEDQDGTGPARGVQEEREGRSDGWGSSEVGIEESGDQVVPLNNESPLPEVDVITIAISRENAWRIQDTVLADRQLLEEHHQGFYRDMNRFIEKRYAALYQHIEDFFNKYIEFRINCGEHLDEDGVPLKKPTIDLLWATKYVKEMRNAAEKDGWPELALGKHNRRFLVHAIIGKALQDEILERPLFGADKKQKEGIIALKKLCMPRDDRPMGASAFNIFLAQLVEKAERGSGWEEQLEQEVVTATMKIHELLQPILALNPEFPSLVDETPAEICKLVIVKKDPKYAPHRFIIADIAEIVRMAADIHLKMRKDASSVYSHPECKQYAELDEAKQVPMNENWMAERPPIKLADGVDEQRAAWAQRARPLIRTVGLKGCTATRLPERDGEEEYGRSRTHHLVKSRVAVKWGVPVDRLTEEEMRRRRSRTLANAFMGRDPMNQCTVQ